MYMWQSESRITERGWVRTGNDIAMGYDCDRVRTQSESECVSGSATHVGWGGEKKA